MVYALTTENKVLLGGMAAIFIVFALVSAFVIPRRFPDYPGERGLRIFVPVTLVLFVLMMVAVELFAVEQHEPGRGEGEHALGTLHR